MQQLPGKGLKAFSLVELLTVIAIVAILATLISASLASAKRKARQVTCTSNLRQISLALNMYLDDYESRPSAPPDLVLAGYLRNRATLVCPEDKNGNWGGIIDRGVVQNPSFSPISSPSPPSFLPAKEDLELPYSYLHPFRWNRHAWNQLLQSRTSVGIAACQLHGLGKPDWDQPDITSFQGLILRAQRDGAVVRRQFFGTTASETSVVAGPPAFQPIASPEHPWAFFTDEPIP